MGKSCIPSDTIRIDTAEDALKYAEAQTLHFFYKRNRCTSSAILFWYVQTNH